MAWPNRLDERNRSIFKEYNEGTSLTILARKHGVTNTRIYLIVKDESKRQGIAKRAPHDTNSDLYNRVHVPDGLVEKYKEGSVSIAKIARLLKRTPNAVTKFLRRAGVPIRPNRANSYEVIDARDGVLYKRYMDGASARELAEEEGVSRFSVSQRIWRYRKAHNLPGKNVCRIALPEQDAS